MDGKLVATLAQRHHERLDGSGYYRNSRGPDLVVDVAVGGATVDDDVVPFGIREIKFDAGMTLSGKAVKFQGAALHQDQHGLGMAAPQQAMQRRLAQLKAFGINAIRTSHEPPSPDFLELTDRMGLLVLEEFFDT